MSMIVGNKELFIMNEVNVYIEKFSDKFQESEGKINQIKAELDVLEIELDKAIEADILEGDSSSKKALSNVQSKKDNLNLQMDIEVKKVMKIKEIMTQGLSKIIPETSKQIQADLNTYNSTVEKEIYKQLAEIRKQQEELLLTLQACHNKVTSELFNFNELCHFANMKQYQKTDSNQIFHNSLFLPHRNYPELGNPLLNCSNLQTLPDILMRNRAEANAMYNSDKSAENKDQLPVEKKLQDIDLEKFLKGLKA